MSVFTCFTNRCRILALLAIAVVAHAVTMEPAPANILTNDKPIDNAWVESETVDGGVVFYLGDWKSQTRVAVTRKPGQYLKVNYVGNSDTTFMRAEVLYTNGDYAAAPEHYKKATTTGKWNWEVEQAYRRAADCLARTGKGAEALALLKEYLGRYPKTVHMAEVVGLRAGLALAAGDFDSARKDFEEMVKNPKWSATSELDGMLGQRDVLAKQKKFAEAVALLNPYWAKLKADDDSDAFGRVALAVASDLDADGKTAECIAALKKTYLAPIANDAQARARLHHAQLLAKPNDTENNLAAFDQVAIAVLLGGDETTSAAASKLARELIMNRIDKDKKVSDEARKEYRSYLSSL